MSAPSTELEQQTGKQARVGYCGNGGSILFGRSPMGTAIMLLD